jgi:predicted aspartyl protease
MPKFHLPIFKNQMLADVFILDDNTSGVKSQVKALFDTGATQTCITQELANFLNLNPIGKTQINTANGTIDVNVYKIKIGLPFPVSNNKIRIEAPEEILAVEVSNNPMWKIIIGMDIIQKGLLIVDNGNYIFSL